MHHVIVSLYDYVVMLSYYEVKEKSIREYSYTL